MNVSELLAHFRHHSEFTEPPCVDVEEILAFAGESPVRINRCFEDIFIAYAALASKDGPRTVIVADSVYDRAAESKLLHHLATRFPQLRIEPASARPRGPSPSLVIMDELADWEPDEIRSHGG